MPSFQAITIVVCLLMVGFLYGLLDHVIEEQEPPKTIDGRPVQWSEQRMIVSEVWKYTPLLFFAACAVYGLATAQKQG